MNWAEFRSCLDGRLKDSWSLDLALQEHSDIDIVALSLFDDFRHAVTNHVPMKHPHQGVSSP